MKPDYEKYIIYDKCILPDSIIKIWDYAFSGCTWLTSIEMSDNVSRIEWGAFQDCTGLKAIRIPSKLTRIELRAFSGCTGLASIDIPSNVTEILWEAFCGCAGLTYINIPDSVARIAAGAISECTGLEKIEVDNNNQNYCSVDNCCLTKDRKTLVFGCKTSIIPEGVIEIEWNAFKGCTGLTFIEIPNSVTKVKQAAFIACI